MQRQLFIFSVGIVLAWLVLAFTLWQAALSGKARAPVWQETIVAPAPPESTSIASGDAFTIISSDADILAALRGFAQKEWAFLPANDAVFAPASDILLAVLEDEVGGLDIRIAESRALLNKTEIGDAPEGRAFHEAFTKLCVAESIVYDDLRKILLRCGLADTYPADIAWEGRADDITAAADILPYFLAGLAARDEDDNARATYYWREIKAHRAVLEGTYGEDFISVAGPVYEQLLSRTGAFLREKGT